jgi:glycosyltransferase involved in cell wall biosynthesis
MKIVVDARMLYWTGVGRYILALLEQLEQIDHENEYRVLVRRADWDKWDPSAANFKKIEASVDPYSVGEQLALPAIIAALKPDLVHFTAPNMPLWYRGRKIVTVHDLTLVDFDTSRGLGLKRLVRMAKRPVFRLVLRSGVRSAVKVVTDTEFVAKELGKRFGVPKRKLRVVPLGFEEPEPAEPERPEEVGEFDDFLFTVGNFYPYKNVGSTVEALKLLSAEFPELKLVAAGQPDWFRDQLEAKVKRLGLGSRVVLPGRVSEGEKTWLYQHARLYVYPSRSEGFGLQGLEAMALGLPVVAAHASSMPEVYGGAAVYFDPLDPKAQAEKIADLLKGGGHRDRLIKAGHERVKLYSWKRMAKRTLEVYEEAVQAKR